MRWESVSGGEGLPRLGVMLGETGFEFELLWRQERGVWMRVDVDGGVGVCRGRGRAEVVMWDLLSWRRCCGFESGFRGGRSWRRRGWESWAVRCGIRYGGIVCGCVNERAVFQLESV